MAYCTISQCCKHTVKDNLCSIHLNIEQAKQEQAIPKVLISQETAQAIFAKVEKLLALAASGSGATIAEAATAGRMAQELLERHNLSLADMPEDKQEDFQDQLIEGQNPWQKHLLHAIAKANFCRAIGDGKAVHIVGKPSNIKIMLHIYEYFKREIWRLAIAAGPGPHGQRQHYTANFCSGAVEEVRRKFQEEKRQQAATDTTSLIKIDKALDAHYHKLYPHIRNSSSRSTYGAGYGEGSAAGRGINLRQGIETGTSTRRLITA